MAGDRRDVVSQIWWDRELVALEAPVRIPLGTLQPLQPFALAVPPLPP